MNNDHLKRQLIEQGATPGDLRRVERQARQQAEKQHARQQQYNRSQQPQWARDARQAAAKITAKFGVRSVNWATSWNSPLVLVLILIAEYVTLAEAFGYLAPLPIALVLAGAVLSMLVYLVFRRAVVEHTTQRGNTEREYLSLWLGVRRLWRFIIGGKRPENETQLDQLDAAVNGLIVLQILGALYARLHPVIVRYNGQTIPDALQGILQSDMNTLFLALLAVLLTVRLITSLEHVARGAASTFVRVAGTDGLSDDFLSGNSSATRSLEDYQSDIEQKLLQEKLWQLQAQQSEESRPLQPSLNGSK